MRSAIAVLVLFTLAAPALAVEDPMRPPGSPQSSPSEPRQPTYDLSSVVIGPERRVAVINGDRVSVGSWVSGAKVVGIAPSRVTLRRNGEMIVLSLLDLQVKEITKAQPE